MRPIWKDDRPVDNSDSVRPTREDGAVELNPDIMRPIWQDDRPVDNSDSVRPVEGDQVSIEPNPSPAPRDIVLVVNPDSMRPTREDGAAVINPDSMRPTREQRAS